MVTLAPHFPAVCSLASCLGTILPSPQPDRQLADSLLSADTASCLWVFTVPSLHVYRRCSLKLMKLLEVQGADPIP